MHDDTLLAMCGSWPGVTADIKWEDDRILSVANKMFCGLALAGAKRGQLSFKVDPDRFLEFTDMPGIHPAPYMARAHWVSVSPAAQPDAATLKLWLASAYAQIVAKLPRKQRVSLGVDVDGSELIRRLIAG